MASDVDREVAEMMSGGHPTRDQWLTVHALHMLSVMAMTATLIAEMRSQRGD